MTGEPPMQMFFAYIVAFLIFGAIDLTWLTTMGAALYRSTLGDILVESPRIAPAIAFYAMFPIGIVVFAVAPALKTGSVATALQYGLLFGAIAYGTYDLTNYATLRNWNLQITVIDIVYGGLLAGTAASIATLAARYLSSLFGGPAG